MVAEQRLQIEKEEEQTKVIDEVTRFLSGNYCAANEAHWRIMEYRMYDCVPSVLALREYMHSTLKYFWNVVGRLLH